MRERTSNSPQSALIESTLHLADEVTTYNDTGSSVGDATETLMIGRKKSQFRGEEKAGEDAERTSKLPLVSLNAPR